MPAANLNDFEQNIRMELDELDQLPVTIGNKPIKASQCYHFSTNPARVLYNTNCPEELKQKIDAILEKYTTKNNEASAELTDIDFTCEEKIYKGWFSTSRKQNEEGFPASFSVVLNEVFFGHLTRHDQRWNCSEQRPANLVQATGKAIEGLLPHQSS